MMVVLSAMSLSYVRSPVNHCQRYYNYFIHSCIMLDSWQDRLQRLCRKKCLNVSHSTFQPLLLNHALFHTVLSTEPSTLADSHSSMPIQSISTTYSTTQHHTSAQLHLNCVAPPTLTTLSQSSTLYIFTPHTILLSTIHSTMQCHRVKHAVPWTWPCSAMDSTMATLPWSSQSTTQC